MELSSRKDFPSVFSVEARMEFLTQLKVAQFLFSSGTIRNMKVIVGLLSIASFLFLQGVKTIYFSITRVNFLI